eukprot:Plantae.Rhodophyta-Rhodochaete_pulchella.ctg9155.p1 GENE.Plantae.Rhodophyta-Rhodochaete_pulchella.ctg9155~~Plantae.Rhodophyta-Rhodochaete_pulchella.ctg9155.p1  ORF type:complete len:236 (+),score=45.52 Plantae.Rhodophyta-Rhodochaete_pulchella.ctg9155:804-1511(+)
MAFDMSPQRVMEARNKGLPVFFGDACRPEVLKAAGIERARALVVTLDDPAAALRAVTGIHQQYPHIELFCRARDAKQQSLLQLAGARAIVPELLEASLLLGGAVLHSYGTPSDEVATLIEEFRQRNVMESGVELPYALTAETAGSPESLEELVGDVAAKPVAVAGNGDDSVAPMAEADGLEVSRKSSEPVSVAPAMDNNGDETDGESPSQSGNGAKEVPRYAETEEEEDEEEEYR